jgi:vitamin B12 transporter
VPIEFVEAGNTASAEQMAKASSSEKALQGLIGFFFCWCSEPVGNNLKCLVLLLFACSAGAYIGSSSMALAQEPQAVTALPPIVVSASRIPTPLEKSPGNTTIITREEIEARKPISMVDLLRQVPGLHIDQVGGRGGVSSVYVRGGDPNFTLVLIDGVKVNDPTNARGGSFDFSTLDVENVERVEIVRGPLSSVHGSDAMAGVINIVTRRGTPEPEYSMEISGGLHGYYRGNVEARGPCSETVNYALSAAYVDNGIPVEGDEFVGKSFNGKVNAFPSDTMQLQWVMRYADNHSESFPDDSGGPEFAVLRKVDERDTEDLTMGLEIGYETLSSLELSLKGGWYHHEEHAWSPGVAPGARDPFGIPPNTSDSTLDRMNIEAKSLISVSDSVRASLGIVSQFEQGSNDTSLIIFGVPVENRLKLDRDMYSPFMELQYSSKIGLTVQGGLCIDIPDDFDTEVSPKVGVIYKIKSTRTTIKANWGKGFKLPSFYALGNPIVGNPELQPETSEGYDFGVIQDLWNKRVSVSATPFYSRFFDVIDLHEGPPPRLVNRSEVTARGIELGVATQFKEKLWLKAHSTYTKTDIKGTDEELRNRPEWRGGINVRWKLKADVALNLDVLYVGKALDSSIPTGDRDLDEYTRIDISAIWTLGPNWRITFAIDNMLDADYEEAVGFPARGIQPRVTARLTF